MTGDPRLVRILELVSATGVRPSDVQGHGLTKADLETVREQVLNALGWALVMRRLRQGWLLDLLAQNTPVASLMLTHGLTAWDLDLAAPALRPAADAASVLRAL